MKGTISGQILAGHLIGGTLDPGEEIAIRIDQSLTQDATGTLAFLEFMAMKQERVRTEVSVSYVDHNTLQEGFENADDHLFLQSTAARYGIVFSPPGNGICHQLHLESFAAPGKTLLGADSHTPTAGGIGMLAVGTGGLEVAAAMAGFPFHLRVPQVLLVNLTGRLHAWSGAKDVILYLLGRLSVKGGVGKIIEYGGEGVRNLSIPQRAAIANMGAELGATTSIFPSDETTKDFLKLHARVCDWKPLKADAGAVYSDLIDVDLATIPPMAALPHSPDKAVPVGEAGEAPVHQVVIGSCTNSSFQDIMRVAWILKGKKIHSNVSLAVAPASRRLLKILTRNGALADLISAGARILEPACGPCIGMGMAPPSKGISVRTFNRNFKGRSGTADAQVYLVGPETAAATALTGKLTDPRILGDPPPDFMKEPEDIGGNHFIFPTESPKNIEIRWGPNIKPLPDFNPLPDSFSLEILLKAGDNITTDDILPAGVSILRLRSNIPAISEYVFSRYSPGFATKAKQKKGGLILGGSNYGQGSSREHAALAPKSLGIGAVPAVSFARIHRSNLINFGIVPFVISAEDYERLREGDIISVAGLRKSVETDREIVLKSSSGFSFKALLDLTERERKILLAGGLLNFICHANK